MNETKLADEPDIDIRDAIFRDIADGRVRAVFRVEQNGIISGIARMTERAREMGLSIQAKVREGDGVMEGSTPLPPEKKVLLVMLSVSTSAYSLA